MFSSFSSPIVQFYNIPVFIHWVSTKPHPPGSTPRHKLHNHQPLPCEGMEQVPTGMECTEKEPRNIPSPLAYKNTRVASSPLSHVPYGMDSMEILRHLPLWRHIYKKPSQASGHASLHHVLSLALHRSTFKNWIKAANCSTAFVPSSSPSSVLLMIEVFKCFAWCQYTGWTALTEWAPYFR